MENWLPIAVGVFWGGMILYGHYRGFIRQAVSMAALLVTLVVVDLSMPYVTDYLKNSTFVYQAFETGVKNATGCQRTDGVVGSCPAAHDHRELKSARADRGSPS